MSKFITALLHSPAAQAFYTWVEHGLVIGGITATADLSAHVSNSGLNSTEVVIAGLILGAASRFFNKLDVQVTPSPPAEGVPGKVRA